MRLAVSISALYDCLQKNLRPSAFICGLIRVQSVALTARPGPAYQPSGRVIQSSPAHWPFPW